MFLLCLKRAIRTVKSINGYARAKYGLNSASFASISSPFHVSIRRFRVYGHIVAPAAAEARTLLEFPLRDKAVGLASKLQDAWKAGSPRFASIVAPSKIEFARVRFLGRDSRPFLTLTKDSFRGGRAALTTRLDGCLVRAPKHRHWIFTRIAAWDYRVSRILNLGRRRFI